MFIETESFYHNQISSIENLFLLKPILLSVYIMYI
jgi:hypothetical protein